MAGIDGEGRVTAGQGFGRPPQVPERRSAVAERRDVIGLCGQDVSVGPLSLVQRALAMQVERALEKLGRVHCLRAAQIGFQGATPTTTPPA